MLRLPLLARVALGFCASLLAAAPVPSPQEHFGFAIGDDYHLATYTQTEAYFHRVAAASPRTRLVDIGRTEEGRTQWMMIVSAPENLARLEQYRDLSRRLARAEDLTAAEARACAATGRAIVWIDGGLHATETVGSHQLIETLWQFAHGEDEETLRLLRDTIILLVHANPDGQELVAQWYQREPNPTQRTLSSLPRLYQKYAGHDNNRDFYFCALRETTNLNRQLYLEWFPQIVYNHHQHGPAGTIMFVPPFRDPFNYALDPAVIVGIEALGNAIQARFLAEHKPGATSRSGASYSTWWNGGLRSTSYFHNQIGLLTEIVGNPTPITIPLVARKQLPSNDLTAPVAPQPWHFRQSIDYSVSANRAVLDYASRHRDQLLWGMYQMGRDAIDRGSRDHWTPRPSRIEEISRRAAAENPTKSANTDGAPDPTDTVDPTSPRATAGLPAKYWDLLHQPAWRDPRGYIIPADQPDFPTAIKFINTLVKNGIALHRATAPFTVAGKSYPAGSYVVFTAQAFRAHVLDMFEPQDHPNDFKVEGGPPTKPYDVAGWTLALQMGLRFDRVLEAFTGPFERLPYGQLQTPPAGRISGQGEGFLVSHRANDAFVLLNRLLRAGAEAYWLKAAPAAAPDWGPGALYVPDRGPAGALVASAAAELGLSVRRIAPPAAAQLVRLAPTRIALWDRFGGSLQSGWTRLVLEQFEFPFQLLYAPRIDAGNLRAQFDVIIFVTGAIPAPGAKPAASVRPRHLPADYASQLGSLSAAHSIPALREFLQAGGTIVTLGSSTSLATHLALPVENALVTKDEAGKTRPLPDEKFYVPGSILEARLDLRDPITWGMPERADFYFVRSPAFHLPAAASPRGVRAVAWFDSAAPLRSGWAWGQKYLENTATVVRAPVGAGTLYLFGSEVAFRAQPHGTFKLLFNALQLATAQGLEKLPDTP